MSLQKIQEGLIAPKSQFNAFGKYHYRSLEDICEALKPWLATYEYSLVITDEIVMIGNRYYVKASAALIDSKGKTIATNAAFAREAETKKGMDESQITGAASSYARKYALNGLFCIDDTKDADTQKPKEEPGQESIDTTDLKTSIDACQTPEDLTSVWDAAVKSGVNKASNRAEIIAMFAARKKELV